MTAKISATVIGLALAAAVVSTAPGVAAKEAKAPSIAGQVTSITDSSLVIEATGNKAMTFVVDSSTHVLGKGAGTKTRAEQALGAKGAAVGDLVHVGDQVKVTYDHAGAAARATEVRVTATKGAR